MLAKALGGLNSLRVGPQIWGSLAHLKSTTKGDNDFVPADLRLQMYSDAPRISWAALVSSFCLQGAETKVPLHQQCCHTGKQL